MSADWRLPENRVEGFQRFYRFQLDHQAHPGAVYMLLPAIAEALELDADGRAWLVWLNGNTQNVVTSLLLLEAAPEPYLWPKAVDFWNDHFKELEWDTDRRHQKSKFGEATEAWAMTYGQYSAADWMKASEYGWDATWKYAFEQPYMGRLSAWSMIEYARILFGPVVPDAATFLLEDKSGSRSHRNGLATVAGYDAVYWDADACDLLGIVPELNRFAEVMLHEMQEDPHPDTSRLTMESSLCTYKSQYKPNRRYPGVYHDMMHDRIRRGEKHFGKRFDLLWETRRAQLPEWLRPEDHGTGSVTHEKQNHFRETGEMVYLDWMPS